MKKPTKTTKKTPTTKAASLPPYSRLSSDLKNALLIFSLVVNLFIFITWVAIRVTNQYDAQLSNFLFTR